MPIKLKKYSFFFTLILFLQFLCKGVSQTVQNNTEPGAIAIYPRWLNSSQIQYNQFLTDSYNYFVTSKGNRVWAGAMSLAWNQLKRRILKGSNTTFFSLNILQQKMIDNLNSEWFTKSEINQNSFYVASGFGQQTVDRINYQVRQKFPSRTFLPLTSILQQQDFISFAYLFKKFRFRHPFAAMSQFDFKGKLVQGFQAATSKMKKQVYYKYYNNSDDFMVGLETGSPNDEILLWKTNQTGVNDAKFDKILKMIEFYCSLPSNTIRRQDKFQMPVTDLEYGRSYQDILKARFSNPGFEEYEISEMHEKIKVKVNRFGATLENQAVVVASRTGTFGGKYFYLNKDFWLIMKEKNKKPYLVMLVKQVSQTEEI